MHRDQTLARQTDLCVKCGLCLPHCPTYRETRDENESPRGRLALIQGWAEGQLPAGDHLQQHTDHCLLCRACEVACPARVPYGEILDRFRGELQASGQTKSRHSPLNTLLTRSLSRGKPGWLRRILARLAHAPKGRTLFRVLGLGAWIQGLPDRPMPDLRSSGTYPAAGVEGANPSLVQLFTGCTTELFDLETLDACLTVLNRLGFTVEIPETQGCCGALDQHAGHQPRALRHIESNQQAFAAHADAPVLGYASGCGAMLREYPRSISSLGLRYRDITEFLAEQVWPASIRLSPLEAVALIHVPCSLKNVLKQGTGAMPLLSRIPKLQLLATPSSIGCCGAAGRFMLDFPEEARRYRTPLIDLIKELRPDVVLTSNPGCAAHLRAGLREEGLGSIEVLHPLTLLARQLP